MSSHSHAHPAPTAAQLTAALKAKFTRLATLQQQINGLKALYAEHDALMSELLPLFITSSDEGWTIRKSTTIGNKTYRFTPGFFDEKKNQIVSKVWKSAAHSSGTIQA
jgi:hypothetical protein